MGLTSRSLWPVTVIKTRYGGTYEGGVWAAFNLEPDNIPDAVMGDDVSCARWWSEHQDGVGVGATAQEAIDALETNPAPLQYGRIAEGVWGIQRQAR